MPTAKAEIAGPLDYTVKDIDGRDYALGQHRGHPVLIVNVASRCGFTKQYAGLEKLYRTYKDRGLVVIGFPANNFGGQEPGTEAEIKEFCLSNFGVSFPMMSKVSVKGEDQHPLFRMLTRLSDPPDDIGWNFAKFLIGPDGKIAARFDSGVTPEDPKLIEAVEKALAAKAS